MNKKLKIYSTLFVVAIIILAVTSTVHYSNYTWDSNSDEKLELVESPSEFMSTDTLANGQVVTRRHPYIGYEVNVEPRNYPNQKILLSKSNGQTYRVNMKKVNLEVPATELHSYVPMIFILSSAAVAIIVAIWIVVLVFKLIRNIRKGDIFVTKVSRYMETAGILLSVLYGTHTGGPPPRTAPRPCPADTPPRAAPRPGCSSPHSAARPPPPPRTAPPPAPAPDKRRIRAA